MFVFSSHFFWVSLRCGVWPHRTCGVAITSCLVVGRGLDLQYHHSPPQDMGPPMDSTFLGQTYEIVEPDNIT
jgi:hypothetical protein